MFYNMANSSLDNIRGKHDFLNSMGAAALSGALYKSTCECIVAHRSCSNAVLAGLRPAAMSAGLMAGAAGAWSGFKRFV